MSSYTAALQDFYKGEVLGEAYYLAILGSARSDDERLKIATLLQLETETKAWLRAPMVAQGVSIEEQAAVREEAIAIAERVKPLSWPEHMEALREAITTEYVPRYQSHAHAARARGRADEEAACLYMVEHEKAQVEFTRRELAGQASVNHLNHW